MGKKAKNDERNLAFAVKTQRRIALTMTGYDRRQEADWLRFISEVEDSAAKAASATATATATATDATTTGTATDATTTATATDATATATATDAATTATATVSTINN